MKKVKGIKQYQIKKLASAVPNHIDKVCVMVNPDLTTIERVLAIRQLTQYSYTAQNLLILYRKLKRNIQALKSLKL